MILLLWRALKTYGIVLAVVAACLAVATLRIAPQWERDVSEIYVEAADVYGRNTLAVQIRAMNLVNEGVKENGGMVVVPSAYTEGFNAAEAVARVAAQPGAGASQ